MLKWHEDFYHVSYVLYVLYVYANDLNALMKSFMKCNTGGIFHKIL